MGITLRANISLLTKKEHLADMERFAALAALICHNNTDKDFVPAEVLRRIIRAGHESILEHIYLTYSIKVISRACLQELARRRHISLSVESTRHTVKKSLSDYDWCNSLLDKIYPTERDQIEYIIRLALISDYGNDILKYFIPEFWPTNLILSSNIRELRHILNLRTAPQALKEFRDLGHELFNIVPEEFKYLLQDCVHQEAEA